MASSRKKDSSSSYFSLKKSANDKIQIIYKRNESQTAMQELLQEVFGCQSAEDPSRCAAWTLGTAESHLDIELDRLQQLGAVNESWNAAGKLGPECVVLEKSSSMGNMMVEPDHLEVFSKSNFSTIKANCCVFKGKWMYECLLGSKGIMQLGWSTATCKFSQEEGVGDTPDSYAYDGNRIRIWNIQTYNYGQAWLTGDVIGVLLDCDRGVVTFYRNGQSMGEAFTTVRFGPGIAYFPAMSLSGGENVRVNFGSTSFRYPVEGYQPLEAPCYIDLIKARHLFAYWDTLVHKWVQNDLECSSKCSSSDVTSTTIVADKRSQKATLMLVAHTLIHRIAPLMKRANIIDECLLGLLEKYCKNTLSAQYIHTTLDIFWALLQDFEIQKCLEFLTISLLSAYRFSPVNSTFSHQVTYLRLLYHLITHERTRQFLLSNILFDKVKLAIFLYIKPPDDEGLNDLVPEVWWSSNKSQDGSVCDAEELRRKHSYQLSCERLRDAVAVLEDLQVEIMKILLTDTDTDKEGTVSSRIIFMKKCREFLRENITMNNRLQLPVVLCFFHRLVRAVRFYCDQWYSNHRDTSLPSHALYIPGEWFSNPSLQYFRQHRMGGSMSVLKKKLKAEAAANSVSQPSSSPSNRSSLSANIEEFFTRFSFGSSNNANSRDDDDDKSNLGDVFCDKSGDEADDVPTAGSLVELLDDLIVLYHLAAHKQLNKMCGLRDSLTDYVNALEDSKKKLENCPVELPEVRGELEKACEVFEAKAKDQARHMSWVISVIYSKDKQEDVFWILDLALSTISEAAGSRCFMFVPELYIETCTKAYSALIHYFHPTISKDSLQRFPEVLHRFAEFLVKNFNNEAIVNHDIRDTITQSLACFVCYPQSLRALETLPEESCTTLVRTLLSFYESYSWAHTNSIIVRIWKGCGFGFRYKHLPDVIPVKHLHSEISMAKLQDACPSMVLQHHIAQVLRSDVDQSTKLLDTILNQLNWTFSECCGNLQKLRERCMSRPGISASIMVDPHHVSLIATCFYTAVSLLRLVEMVVHLCPEVLTDWTRPSAELLLCRLLQLLTQILNRMTSKSNVFDAVSTLNISGLETISHFPILTGVAGVLIQMILHGDPKSQQCATSSLLAEPGFAIHYLEYLLGRRESDDTASSNKENSEHVFSFTNYSEISEEEVQEMEMLIVFLKSQMKDLKQQQEEIDEDLLCEICYARAQSVQFQPCKHQSCRSCINHHMLTQSTCFFCKASIKTLGDIPAPKLS